MNVNSPEFLENPYRFYKARRNEAPIYKRNEHLWTITGYEEASNVLANSAAGRGNIGQFPTQGSNTSELDKIKNQNPALQILDEWMLFKNPPEHGCMRKQISDVFTIKMINQLELLMRETIVQLVANIKRQSSNNCFDLVQQIAYPFPITVICEMIGIPKEDRDQFRQWTQNFSVAVEKDFLLIPKDVKATLNQSASELESYFKQLIPTKMSEAKDDLMTRLINLSDGNLSEQEILANCVFLLFAGQDTTTCLIANTINALIKKPDQFALLRSDPSLIKNTVEECLRYDPSIQMVGRYALDDIKETQIKRGDHMFVFLGAAGHDPAANPEPEKFDITRANIKHLAFARGAHHCLGASLARLELKVVLEELIKGFTTLEFDGLSQRRGTWLMRGFDTLPLKYNV